MQAPQFTDAPFRRSHMKAPKGRGSWAFQATLTDTALDRDLVGEVWFSPGALTLTEAKKAAREQFAATELVAVMP